MAGASLAAGMAPKLEPVHRLSSSQSDVFRSRSEGLGSGRHSIYATGLPGGVFQQLITKLDKKNTHL